MKYLTFEQGDNHPICIIKEAKDKKLKNKIIYSDDKSKSIHAFNEMKLKSPEYFQLIPNNKFERSILYVAGNSGSGKTYFIKKYLLEYKDMYPSNEIYCFSPFDEDKSFEGIKINHIKIDDELIEDKLTSKDFENSIVIFDDCEAIGDRSLKKEVERIMKDVLTTGRHHRVSACVVFHEICNGPQTKQILNESSSITFFPLNCGPRILKYLCENYLGLDKAIIQRIKKLKTRACTVIKGYPKILLAERNIFTLTDVEDSSDDDLSSSDEERDKNLSKKDIKKTYESELSHLKETIEQNFKKSDRKKAYEYYKNELDKKYQKENIKF